MTTCLDIITRAYRMAGGLRDSAAALDASDAAIGLTELQSVILALPGMGWWRDVETDEDYTAGENERVRVNTASPVTVTVPTAVSSARQVLTCCNQIELVCEDYDDRAPKDGARVHITDTAQSVNLTYFYRADTAEWIAANGLALTSDVPLNADLHLQLCAMLALILAASEGLEAPATTQRLAMAGQSTMRARFGKRQDVAVDYPLRGAWSWLA